MAKIILGYSNGACKDDNGTNRCRCKPGFTSILEDKKCEQQLNDASCSKGEVDEKCNALDVNLKCESNKCACDNGWKWDEKRKICIHKDCK